MSGAWSVRKAPEGAEFHTEVPHESDKPDIP
jgi:hypothetical protein